MVEKTISRVAVFRIFIAVCSSWDRANEGVISEPHLLSDNTEEVSLSNVFECTAVYSRLRDVAAGSEAHGSAGRLCLVFHAVIWCSEPP